MGRKNDEMNDNKKIIGTDIKVWTIDDRSIQLLIMRGKITHF